MPGLRGYRRKHKVEVRKRMQEALELHIEGLRADGEPVPVSTTSSCYVEVAA
jgi:predicted RNase H-like HicB family nuclease